MEYYTSRFCIARRNKAIKDLEDAITRFDNYLKRDSKLNLFYEDEDIAGSEYRQEFTDIIKDLKKNVKDVVDELEKEVFVEVN